MMEINTEKRKTAKRLIKNGNVSHKYDDDIAEIKTELGVGSIFLKWCEGSSWFKVIAYNTLPKPCPNAPRRTMYIVAERTERPSADSKRYFFSDLVQFAKIELHDYDLDGKEIIITIPA